MSVLLLGSASVESLIGEVGNLTQAILFCFTTAMLSKESGANRRGMLFISIMVLASEVMVKYRKFVKEDLEDMGPCTPILIGASMQAVLLAMMLYAFSAEDDGYRQKNASDVSEELRSWLAVILFVTAVRSILMHRECERGRGRLSDLFELLRILFLVAVCVAHGEDETDIDEN